MIGRAQEGLRAMTWAATAPAQERITVGPGGSEELYASFAEALGSAGQVSAEEHPDGSRLFRVRHEKPCFFWCSELTAYDRAQRRMERWFASECGRDTEVARLAIAAFEELEGSGGPEDVRARETLERLLEIARGPRPELVGFPRAAQSSE